MSNRIFYDAIREDQRESAARNKGAERWRASEPHAMRFYSSCVCWPEDARIEGGLCDMISSGEDITRTTFLKHVNREEQENLERELGYEKDHRRGLTMKNDYHVSYHRSRLHGERVYYFKHSAIEFVFK